MSGVVVVACCCSVSFMHACVIVHVLDSKCARVHVCCACLFVRLCVCLAACIIHVHNSCFLLIFSHCPVQSGKKCLETRFVIVLVCSNRSRCFASALTDHSSTLSVFSTIRAYADSPSYVAPPRLASNCSSSCMASEQRGGDDHEGCVRRGR